MHRHLGYPSKKLLQKHLIANGPRHSYHSATYYAQPSSDTMDKKGELGCDFVVDIDADHIPTDCREKHNYTICKSCGFQIQGEKPEACPECQHTKFDKITWICDECLEVSKKQVYNLVENFLIQEFAIDPQDIQLLFSGHRGYHIHLETDAFRNLDQNARREITDYVTGEGFSFKLWDFKKTQNVMHGFTTDQIGWPGKIAQEFYKILVQGEPVIQSVFKHPIYEKPINTSLINQLVKERQYLMGQLADHNPIWGIEKIGEATWHRIFAILRDRIKADIDVVVSIDLHRLIRLNGSLHGKTGFRVMTVDYDRLKEFDPLVDALPYPTTTDNMLRLEITSPVCPAIRIGDVQYGPYNHGEKITVPLNTGIFFLCKDVANLMKN
jgi:DNA primase small subunit